MDGSGADSGVSTRMYVATDVAHIVMFHPDDLEHAGAWPLGWYGERFVYPVESAAGRLVAWGTTSDGGFDLRVTHAPLCTREERYAGPRWQFPYTVRHGRVYFDNTDGLPGQEQMADVRNTESCSVALPNGDYVVTVTAIEGAAEPESAAGGAAALPAYVVQFSPKTGPAVPPAQFPPQLPCRRDMVGQDACRRETTRPAVEEVDFTRRYPAFVSTNVARAGGSFTSAGEAPLWTAVSDRGGRFALYDAPFVVAAHLVPGAPAILAQCTGSHGTPGAPRSYTFRAKTAVRIAAVDGSIFEGVYEKPRWSGLFRRQQLLKPEGALDAVRIVPVAQIEDSAEVVTLEDVRDQVLADLNGQGPLSQKLGGQATFEALRVVAMDRGDALANWLLDVLPLNAADRLGVSVLPPHAKLAAVAEAYDALCL
ncbi:hypothetical protein TRM7557_01333 [Tritonibacter multivorans]|uniref:Uncharacterized protein n=2 Tax=Tritonibacter multivorans TaxID=928856 RepID=A0A0P1GQ23_9RHOB|nr:hypothetical protein [Tritonibacter multivorans]MDA7422783.1 hypothetical protein [Tritonibacter multivorans]CUH77355.1 hypothetical protein TRM7557_01333 [Tritonibacter multivorans]SFD60036.1 hypothetical protein SAMN04488049_11746 [Tritonibacter multivorans]